MDNAIQSIICSNSDTDCIPEAKAYPESIFLLTIPEHTLIPTFSKMIYINI